MLSESGPSTSSTEKSTADDVDARALKLLGEGKRHVLVGDAPTAVTSLQEACEILASKYGEISDQCAETYYQYGNALLELGRMECGVLGNALVGAPDTVPASDTEDETENIGKPSKLEDAGAGTSGGETGDGTSSAASATEDSDDEAEDTADEGNKEENPDDVPNFQLAWEMLELSRIIFSRKNNKEFRLKVAQVHFKLGELGLETEQYAQSLDDFSKCLQIQKEHLEPESRLIAGSHYNLGLAYSFDSKMDKSMEHFSHAKKTIEVRVMHLESDIKEKEDKKEKSDDDTIKKLRQEISELEELIPDIVAKIDDTIESKNQAAAAQQSSFDQPSSSAGASTATIKPMQVKRKSENTPVCDITHLVKRKKLEEANGTDGTATMKENGSGDSKCDAKQQVNGNSIASEAKDGTTAN